MGVLKNKSANSGKKERKRAMVSAFKETPLSENSKTFITTAETIFGNLVAVYVKERLVGLPDEMQSELVWHVIHYMYFEEILPTGDPDVDIKISEIVSKLPFINLEVFRWLSRDKIKKLEKTAKVQNYSN